METWQWYSHGEPQLEQAELPQLGIKSILKLNSSTDRWVQTTHNYQLKPNQDGTT